MPAPLNLDDFGGELFNLSISDRARPLLGQVKDFIRDEVEPMEVEFFALGESRQDRWSYAPGQLDLLEGVKTRAKTLGLWNFFLPNAETGEGLSNLDYAYIAFELGKTELGPECLNCSAPDTGNMEVLERVGTPEQKKKWLEPLLSGEIRSAYAMTEPNMGPSVSTPGVSIGTRIWDCWRCDEASGLVLTITIMTLQRGSPAPLVKYFSPLITHSSPSRMAEQEMFRASEEAMLGSVIA